VALPRRQVFGARRGRLPRLHLGPEQGLRAHSRAALEGDSAGAGCRLPSASASKSATPMPVKGQARYELWKTRLKKSRTNIETEKPIAPAHRVPARRWAKSSHAVSGSQSRSASQTNG